jgi:hypothetical protein
MANCWRMRASTFGPRIEWRHNAAERAASQPQLLRCAWL